MRAGLARAPARRRLGRAQAEGERLRELASLLQVDRERHRHRVQLARVQALQLLGREAVPQRAALAGDGRVERVLVERVHEAEARRGLAHRELGLAQGDDQAVHALQAVETLLDLELVLLRQHGDHTGGERVALDAARLQQAAVALVQPVDAVLQDAHQALGHVLLDRLEGPRERQAARVAHHGARLQQVLEDARHEERVALGLAAHERDEGVGRRDAELRLQVRADLGLREQRRLDLRPGGHPLAVAQRLAERMPRDLDVLRPVGGDDQHAAVGDARRQEREQVDAEGVGPVHVLEREHDESALRERRQRVEQLARHAVARALRRLAGGGAVRRGRQVHGPGGRHARQRPRGVSRARGLGESAQRLQHGLVRLGRAEVLGRAPHAGHEAGQQHARALQERVQQRALAHAGRARDRDQPAPALPRVRKAREQRVHLRDAPQRDRERLRDAGHRARALAVRRPPDRDEGDRARAGLGRQRGRERLGERARAREAIAGLARDRLQDRLRRVLRQVRPQLAGRRGRAREVRGQHRARARALERVRARERLVAR